MKEPETTERGFEKYGEFVDSYRHPIRVQESSNAEGPHVWIFVDRAPGEPEIHLGKVNIPSAHLNVEQATKVRDALDWFIKRAPSRWSKEPSE